MPKIRSRYTNSRRSIFIGFSFGVVGINDGTIGYCTKVVAASSSWNRLGGHSGDTILISPPRLACVVTNKNL